MDQDLGSPDFRVGISYSACKSLENYGLLGIPHGWVHDTTPPPHPISVPGPPEEKSFIFDSTPCDTCYYTPWPGWWVQCNDSSHWLWDGYCLCLPRGPHCELGTGYAEVLIIPSSKDLYCGRGDDRNSVSGDHCPLHYPLPHCQRNKGKSVWCFPGCIK